MIYLASAALVLWPASIWMAYRKGANVGWRDGIRWARGVSHWIRVGPPNTHRKENIENLFCCIGFGLCVFATFTWVM